jgi:hypothetical protein
MGAFRLKRGQVVEIIPDEDPLNISKCHVIWIGKPRSKQAGGAAASESYCESAGRVTSSPSKKSLVDLSTFPIEQTQQGEFWQISAIGLAVSEHAQTRRNFLDLVTEAGAGPGVCDPLPSQVTGSMTGCTMPAFPAPGG